MCRGCLWRIEYNLQEIFQKGKRKKWFRLEPNGGRNLKEDTEISYLKEWAGDWGEGPQVLRTLSEAYRDRVGSQPGHPKLFILSYPKGRPSAPAGSVIK